MRFDLRGIGAIQDSVRGHVVQVGLAWSRKKGGELKRETLARSQRSRCTFIGTTAEQLALLLGPCKILDKLVDVVTIDLCFLQWRQMLRLWPVGAQKHCNANLSKWFSHSLVQPSHFQLVRLEHLLGAVDAVVAERYFLYEPGYEIAALGCNTERTFCLSAGFNFGRPSIAFLTSPMIFSSSALLRSASGNQQQKHCTHLHRNL